MNDNQHFSPGENPASTPPTQMKDKISWLWGGRVLGAAVLCTFIGSLAVGASRYNAQRLATLETSDLHRNFVPSLRVAPVRASDAISIVRLPATTTAFTEANIFARASGYIERRNVDIGDHVKEGQLLAKITAPELDDQIAQAEATLGQLKAAEQQAQANRDLARVTWQRDSPLVSKGWVTSQQGDVDRLGLQAQEAAHAVAQSNVTAQEAQLQVLRQQKVYQDVIAPFDGVITQRNINIGDLVQADATSGTFMFTIMNTSVIRTTVFVPQDQAFGLSPGVDAVVSVPEFPDRAFPGKVTRIADALQPGTRTLQSEVDIPNRDGALTSGLYCTIELHIPRKTPSLQVPAEAVIFNRDGVQVAVVENGTAHIRKVSVVRDLGTNVEVSNGVKEGDQVILNPPVDLVDGSKVQIRRENIDAIARS